MRPEPLLGAGVPLLGSPRSCRCVCPFILTLLALRGLGHAALIVRYRENAPLARHNAMRTMRVELMGQAGSSADVRRDTPESARMQVYVVGRAGFEVGVKSLE